MKVACSVRVLRRACGVLAVSSLAASAAVTLHAQKTAPATLAPAAPAANPNVSVRTSVDRPAIWVADRVTYTIEITCANGFDILADDLSRDRLKLTGLDVIGSDVARDAAGGETRYAFRYVFTTYRVDTATLTIAPFTARYFVRRPGMRPEEATPAGTIQIPGMAIARRSLLPDDQPTYDIRDQRPADVRPATFALLMPVGAGLLLLSAAPVVLLAIAVGRRLYARRAAAGSAPSARQTRHAARERLEAVRLTDSTDADARREGFAQLDALVRAHVRDVSGVPAPSLTPPEIVRELAPALATRRSRLSIDLVRGILATCEIARYAPPERLPAADAWRDTLADAEQVLASH